MQPQQAQARPDQLARREDRSHLHLIGPDMTASDVRESVMGLRRNSVEACLPELLRPSYDGFRVEMWRFIDEATQADTAPPHPADLTPLRTLRLLHTLWVNGVEILGNAMTEDGHPAAGIVRTTITNGEPYIAAVAERLAPALAEQWLNTYQAYGRFLLAAATTADGGQRQARAILGTATTATREAARGMRARRVRSDRTRLARMTQMTGERMRAVEEALAETERRHSRSMANPFG